MPGFGSRSTPRAALVEDLDDLVRRLTVENERLAHEFASRHDLHSTDFQALVHVMEAEGRGTPLTPGELGQALSLSSGATTAVVDRLERTGHVRRDRDPGDRRRVLLRWGEEGMAVGQEFFGGLGPLRAHSLQAFSDAELAVVRRFLAGLCDDLARHRTAIERGGRQRPDA